MGWRYGLAVVFFLVLLASVFWLVITTMPAVRQLPEVDQPPDVFTTPLHGQTPIVYSGKYVKLRTGEPRVVAPLGSFPELAVDMSGNIVYPN
jgi:hypothetical protein